MLIGTAQITGTDVEIHADASGEWQIREMNTEREDGNSRRFLGRGETLDAAKNAARTTLRKRKVEVAVNFKDAEGNDCVAYGIHAGNGDVLAKVAGEPERLRYSVKVFDPDTTPEEFAVYLAAGDAYRQAANTITAFEKEHGINLKAAVQRAIDAAVDEQVAA